MRLRYFFRHHRQRRIVGRSATLVLALLLIYGGWMLLSGGSSVESFGGMFILAIGGQILLWAIGIRLDLLGTNENEEVPYEDSEMAPAFLQPETAQESLYGALRIATEYLRGAERAFADAPIPASELRRFDRLSRELAKLLASKMNAAAVIVLTSEIERFARSAPSVGQEGRKWRGPEEWYAYDAFWQLRNRLVHGHISVSEPEALELVDIGLRLARVLASNPSLNAQATAG